MLNIIDNLCVILNLGVAKMSEMFMPQALVTLTPHFLAAFKTFLTFYPSFEAHSKDRTHCLCIQKTKLPETLAGPPTMKNILKGRQECERLCKAKTR